MTLTICTNPIDVTHKENKFDVVGNESGFLRHFASGREEDKLGVSEQLQTEEEFERLDKTSLSSKMIIPSQYFPNSCEFWDDPIPYLFPFLMEPSHVPLGIRDEEEHPGKPPSQSIYEASPLSFDHSAEQSFRKSSDASFEEFADEVVDVCRMLYEQNPAFDTERPSKAIISNYGIPHKFKRQNRNRMSYERKDRSAALVARALLYAAPEFSSVIPVRLEFDLEEPSPLTACHYGFLITLVSDEQTILSLCL